MMRHRFNSKTRPGNYINFSMMRLKIVQTVSKIAENFNIIVLITPLCYMANTHVITSLHLIIYYILNSLIYLLIILQIFVPVTKDCIRYCKDFSA